MARELAERSDIVERIDEAEIGKLGVLPRDRRIGRLDVEICDIVRQDRDFVGVQLLLVFVRQLLRLAAKMLQQFADESPGSGRGIENFDAFVDQRLAEMLLAQPVRALDHEAHDLLRRIDHAEPVGRLLVVNLVEILVDDFEEFLPLVVGGNLVRRRADRIVIRVEGLHRILFQRAGEKQLFEVVEFLGDIVLAMKFVVVEHFGEYLFRQDVLDQHFAYVFRRHGGVDAFLCVLEKFDQTGLKRRIGLLRRLDHLAQRLQNRRQIGLKLRDRLTELQDFRSLIAKEQFKQMLQLFRVEHGTAHDFNLILDQNSRMTVFE